MYRYAWSATNVTEQPFQYSDRIRRLDQPGECRKEPGQRRIVEVCQWAIEHQPTHKELPPVDGLFLLGVLCGLDLGQCLSLDF